MIIGTIRAPEETGIYNEYEGSHHFHTEETQEPYGLFEVFHHEGGHMIEPDPDDDMPLDDWRDAEAPGWYWRDCCTGHDPVGPFPTSRAALEDADVWNPVFDEN